MPVRVAQTEQGSGPSGAPPFATMATLSASLRHRMPLAAQPPATCAWGAPQSDTLVGELERRHEVVTCRGKRPAAVDVLSRPGACCSPGLAGARRGRVLVVPWMAFPASSSRRGLVLRAAVPASSSCQGLALFGCPSRQDPLAGALAQILCP